MDSLRQIWQCCLYNFRGWRRNPRIALTFLLALALCFLLTDKAVAFAREHGTLLQAVEPFIWAFGDGHSILLSSLLLILLFSDMPFLGPGVPYYLVRTTRSRWLMGQALYITLATVLYLAFLLAASVAVCAPGAFIGNQWSRTAAILGYSPAGEILSLPSSVKVMELSTPYQTMAAVFGLMVLYTLVCAFVMFWMNLLRGRRWGVLSVFAFSLYGFLLSPQSLRTLLNIRAPEYDYMANVAAGWASPLNHATYAMHNFGYDMLPRLHVSYMLFGVLLIALWALCALAARRYNFRFNGGNP